MLVTRPLLLVEFLKRSEVFIFAVRTSIELETERFQCWLRELGVWSGHYSCVGGRCQRIFSFYIRVFCMRAVCEAERFGGSRVN